MHPAEIERQELILFKLFRHRKHGWRCILPDDLRPYDGTIEIGQTAATNIFEAIEHFRRAGLLD